MNKLKNYVIYLLKDPRPGHEFTGYIGFTSNQKQRLGNHLNPSQLMERTPKNNWIKSILAIGLKPTMEILFETSDDKWQEDEMDTIGIYRLYGWNLKNMTDGGEGCPGHKMAEESCRKIALSMTGKKRGPPSDEHKKNLSLSLSGMKRPPFTEEHKMNLSLAHKGQVSWNKGKKGRPLSEEHKMKLYLANKGTHHIFTEEHKRNMSLAHRGPRKPRSEETKLKISLANKGKKLSEDHKKKLSAAKKHNPLQTHTQKEKFALDLLLVLNSKDLTADQIGDFIENTIKDTQEEE